MDEELIVPEPDRQVGAWDVGQDFDYNAKPAWHRKDVHAKHKKVVYNAPTHTAISAKGVRNNIPAFANFRNVIEAKPSHSSLTQSEVDKATLVNAMYEQNDMNASTIQEYLTKQNSPYSLVAEVSNNVMVVRSNTSGETKVVVKGINPRRVSDLSDLQLKLVNRQQSTQTYRDALNAVLEYDAREVIGHSRGGSTAIAVAQTTGIRSTGFNSVITNENVRKSHYAPSAFKHTEFSNGSDIIVNSLNDVSNPHGFGRHPDNMGIRTFAGIKGASTLGQHDVAQWTEEKLLRNDTIGLPAEVLAFQGRHAGDIITAEMFAQGIREGKTYRQILMSHEGGFGVADERGTFTARNFRGNNMSRIFEAVGGEHTEDELAEMASHGTQPPSEHTLTENELAAIKAGDGVDLIDHALDEVAGSYERLPPVQRSALRDVGKGIYKGVSDALPFKQSAIEGLAAGIVGEYGASEIESVVGRAPGELGNVQHSGTSFAIAGGLIGGVTSAAYGFGAGAVGEGVRYGTDKLLQKLGAGDGVRGNLDALMQGAASGMVLGAEAGPVTAAIGAGIGAIVSEGAHLASEYGDKIKNFFENIF